MKLLKFTEQDYWNVHQVFQRDISENFNAYNGWINVPIVKVGFKEMDPYDGYQMKLQYHRDAWIKNSKLNFSKDWKESYLKFRKEIFKGNTPDIGDNYGYAICMYYELTKLYPLDEVKQCYLALSQYTESYAAYQCYQELVKESDLTLDNVTFKKVKDSVKGIYVESFNTDHLNDILFWLNHKSTLDGLCIIHSNRNIDIIEDTRYDNLLKKINKQDKHKITINLEGDKYLPDYIKFNKCWCSFKLTNFKSTYYEDQHEIQYYKTLSLQGCPKEINGNFIADHINLDSLNGGPVKVAGDYLVNPNNLNSLNGAPEYVGGKFNLNNNNLTDNAIKECIESSIEYNWKEISIRNNPELIRYRNTKNW